jgi:DNA-directed RNA polymerase subunit RPC12/RpoP
MSINVKFVTATKLEQLTNEDNIKNCGNGSFVFCEENERMYIIMKDKLIGITPSKNDIEQRKRRKVNCCNCGGLLPKQEEYSSVIECPYCGSIQDIEDIIEVN